MKSIKQQYIDLQEGKMSQSNFMRNVRMTLPQFITNVTSYNDTVRILKNKGIITEAQINEVNEQPWEGIKLNNNDLYYSPQKRATYELLKVNPDGNKVSLKIHSLANDMQVDENINIFKKDIYNNKLFKVTEIITPENSGLNYSKWEQFKDKSSISEEDNNPEEDTMSDDEFDALIAQEEDKEDAEKVMGDKSDFSLNEAKTKWENTSGKAMYDQFREIDNMNSYEVMIGINFEMEKNHELNKKEATKIVIRNLKKNPNYYTATYASGVEGYEIPSMSAKPEAWQMKYLTKDNLVDKEMGMKPVKNIAKAKASANKANKETNKAKDIDVLSLVAQTLRGVPKMQSQGEKMKTIKLRETIQRLVKEVLEEDKTLNEDFKYFKDFAEFEKDLFDKWPDAEKYKKEYEDGRIVYSDGYVNWGIWDPNRPNTPSKLPPGAVNQKVGMTARDIMYPNSDSEGIRMD